MLITNFKSIPIVWHNEVFKPQQNEINFIKSLKLKQIEFSKIQGTIDSYIFNNNELKNLKDIALKYAKQFVNELLEIETDYYLTQSWATITPKNEKHHPHTHKNTFFGMVMYLQAERNNGGELVIQSDRSMLSDGFNFDYNIKNYNIYNSSSYTYPVGTGDIIIFPGWLNHYTLPNLSDKDRIAIGVDFFIKGTMGNDEHWSKITI